MMIRRTHALMGWRGAGFLSWAAHGDRYGVVLARRRIRRMLNPLLHPTSGTVLNG